MAAGKKGKRIIALIKRFKLKQKLQAQPVKQKQNSRNHKVVEAKSIPSNPAHSMLYMSHATPRWGKRMYRVLVPEKLRARGNKALFLSAGFRGMREKYQYHVGCCFEYSRAGSNRALGGSHVTVDYVFLLGSSLRFFPWNVPFIFLFYNSPGDLECAF